jgi:hypothetical protein
MIKILELRLTQVSPSFITLTWFLESTTENLSDYHVNIYKSELPSSNDADYDVVASGISPQGYHTYDDYSIQGLTSKFATYTYRIKVIHNITGSYTTSKPATVNVERDNDARYIIKHRELVLNRLSGAWFNLLKLKTYGTFCPNCYDETLQRNVNSKCPICFDTGFVGGYYLPHKFRAQMNNNPPRSVLTTYGDWQDGDGIVTMSNTPVLSPKDVIVDRFSSRWVVLTIKTTNKALFLLSQQAQVRQIELDDVVNTIPISW